MYYLFYELITNPPLLRYFTCIVYREVAEDDVEVLDFLSASPYHLRRENLGLENRYEERMNVQRFSQYKQKEMNYWQVSHYILAGESLHIGR